MNNPHRLYEGLPFDLPPLELRFARMSEPYGTEFQRQQYRHKANIFRDCGNAEDRRWADMCSFATISGS